MAHAGDASAAAGRGQGPATRNPSRRRRRGRPVRARPRYRPGQEEHCCSGCDAASPRLRPERRTSRPMEARARVERRPDEARRGRAATRSNVAASTAVSRSTMRTTNRQRDDEGPRQHAEEDTLAVRGPAGASVGHQGRDREQDGERTGSSAISSGSTDQSAEASVRAMKDAATTTTSRSATEGDGAADQPAASVREQDERRDPAQRLPELVQRPDRARAECEGDDRGGYRGGHGDSERKATENPRARHSRLLRRGRGRRYAGREQRGGRSRSEEAQVGPSRVEGRDDDHGREKRRLDEREERQKSAVTGSLTASSRVSTAPATSTGSGHVWA